MQRVAIAVYLGEVLMRLLFLVAISALIAPAAVAQGGCEQILQYINVNTQKNFTSLTIDQINDASFCSERYQGSDKGRSASIEASYKLFSGSGSSSETDIRREQEKRCGSRFGRDYLQSIGVTESTLVSPEAVSAVKSCYAQRSLILTSLASNDRALTATVEWRGAGVVNWGGVWVGGGDGAAAVAQCGAQYKGSLLAPPAEVASNTPVIVTCTRAAERRTMGGQDYRVFPGGMITIKAHDAIAIPLERVSEPALPPSDIARLNNAIVRIDRLSSASSQISDTITAILRRLATPYSGHGEVAAKVRVDGPEISCPPGTYVTGLSLLDEDGGRYCTSCKTGAVLTCSKLPLVPR